MESVRLTRSEAGITPFSELETHLSEKSDRLLLELLGIADVTRDDLVETELLPAFFRGTLLSELFGTYCDLSSYSVLGLQDCRIDGVLVEDSLAWHSRAG